MGESGVEERKGEERRMGESGVEERRGEEDRRELDVFITVVQSKELCDT